MKLTYLFRLVGSHHIQLADLLLGLSGCIVQCIIRFDNTGANLDQRIFSDKRICDSLEYICRLGSCKVIIALEDLVGLHIDTGAFLLVR